MIYIVYVTYNVEQRNTIYTSYSLHDITLKIVMYSPFIVKLHLPSLELSRVPTQGENQSCFAKWHGHVDFPDTLIWVGALYELREPLLELELVELTLILP